MRSETRLPPRRFALFITAVLLAGQGTMSLAQPFDAAQGRRKPAARPQPVPLLSFYEVHEQSITDLQAAMTTGKVTARGLVDSYLARIQAYDQAGPQLNAMVTFNPRAREEADALDRERAEKGVRGPLHGIPVLIKDNYDTADMPTSGGNLGLATMQPAADAYQVRKLRQAGAVILGKTTMHELAAGMTTISSLTNTTRNPYDLLRVPGGSSGGTGAAIGASFAAAGMGSFVPSGNAVASDFPPQSLYMAASGATPSPLMPAMAAPSVSSTAIRVRSTTSGARSS